MKSWWQKLYCPQKQMDSRFREIVSVVWVAAVSVLHVNKHHFLIVSSPKL